MRSVALSIVSALALVSTTAFAGLYANKEHPINSAKSDYKYPQVCTSSVKLSLNKEVLEVTETCSKGSVKPAPSSQGFTKKPSKF